MMDKLIKDKFSKKQLFQIFVFCTLPFNVWTILNVFTHIPSWIMYQSAWDFIGTISYTLSPVLLEAMIVFGFLFGLGVVIPKKFLGENFTVLSYLFVIGVTVVLTLFIYYPKLYFQKREIVLAFSIWMAGLGYLITRFEKFKSGLDFIFDRLLILAYPYFGLNVIAVLIVLIRNL